MWGFVVASVAPIVFRVLAALGMGWLTFSGFTLALNSFKATIAASWGAMPSHILQLLSLASFPEALGMMLGALTFRVAYMAIPKLGKLSGS